MNKEDAKNLLKMYKSSDTTLMVGETGIKEHEIRKEHEDAMKILYGPRARANAVEDLNGKYFG